MNRKLLPELLKTGIERNRIQRVNPAAAPAARYAVCIRSEHDNLVLFARFKRKYAVILKHYGRFACHLVCNLAGISVILGNVCIKLRPVKETESDQSLEYVLHLLVYVRFAQDSCFEHRLYQFILEIECPGHLEVNTVLHPFQC